jgi:hypothetical protein
MTLRSPIPMQPVSNLAASTTGFRLHDPDGNPRWIGPQIAPSA